MDMGPSAGVEAGDLQLKAVEKVPGQDGGSALQKYRNLGVGLAVLNIYFNTDRWFHPVGVYPTQYSFCIDRGELHSKTYHNRYLLYVFIIHLDGSRPF